MPLASIRSYEETKTCRLCHIIFAKVRDDVDQRHPKQVSPHSNAVVIACQQDKHKDHPYLLPLGGGQHYCHGIDYFLILGLDTYHRIQLKNIGYLTGKIHKKDKFGRNYLRQKN